MILKDKNENEYEFTGHDIEIESGRWGRLKPINKPKYVEGALMEGADGFIQALNPGTIYVVDKNRNLDEYPKNIPDETLIKTIVQNWFPDCTSVNTKDGDINFQNKNDDIITYIHHSDKFNFEEIKIRRI